MVDKVFSCTAVSCVRQMTGPKSYANYLVEENCRYALTDTCTFPKKEKKPKEAHAEAKPD